MDQLAKTMLALLAHVSWGAQSDRYLLKVDTAVGKSLRSISSPSRLTRTLR
jgi:hypothetical protein